MHLLVERVREVRQPHQRVRVDVHNLTLKEARAVRDSLAILDVIFVGERATVAISVVKVVLNAVRLLGSLLLVNPEVEVIELARIQHATAQVALFGSQVHRLDDFRVFNRGVATRVPHQFAAPIQMCLHRIGVLQTDVLLKVCRIVHVRIANVFVVFYEALSQAVAQNGVTHPLYKLTVLVVGDFGLIHIKGGDAHRFGRSGQCRGDVNVRVTHIEGTLGNVNHSVGIRRVKFRAVLDADEFAVVRTRTSRQ